MKLEKTASGAAATCFATSTASGFVTLPLRPRAAAGPRRLHRHDQRRGAGWTSGRVRSVAAAKNLQHGSERLDPRFGVGMEPDLRRLEAGGGVTTEAGGDFF